MKFSTDVPVFPVGEAVEGTIVLPVEVDRDKAPIPLDKMVDEIGPRSESINERLVPSLERG